MGCAQVSAASQRHPTAPCCQAPTMQHTYRVGHRTGPSAMLAYLACEGRVRRDPQHTARRYPPLPAGVWVAGWDERATGCAFAGVSGMCLGGRMRRCQEPIEAAQSSHHLQSRAESPVEQNKEQRTTARRPHSSQQGRDHHDTQTPRPVYNVR